MDKTTKLLLALIALGLWANVLFPLLRPAPIAAQDFSGMEGYLGNIETTARGIANDLDRIERGACSNDKIC
jgi:hypothetical protein